jgi:hypothetical protein
MHHIRLTLSTLFTLIATNASAATGESYNFLPLTVLLVANLLISGLLFFAAAIMLNAWRTRRFAHARATARNPTKAIRSQRVNRLPRRANKL